MATTPGMQGAAASEFDEWEHLEAAKKITGLHTNQVYVQPLGDGLVRVNFGEVLDAEPKYHTALVMTATNAALFGDLIVRMGLAVLSPEPVATTGISGGKDGQ